MNGHYETGDVVLGNWKLQRLIGEGGYGKVYETIREDFGITYKAAIKIITIPQSDSEVKNARAEGMDDESVTAYFRGFVEELVQEFVLMSKLKGNSNVVSYEDHTVIEHDNGVGWDIIIRMELLTPLLDYIQSNQLTRKDVTKLGIDICKALELCQKYNIVHRDIKPENIFVSELGDFKLGDFGIARTVEKTTGGLSKKGTYTYMAPEVYKEEPYNSNVDIYSLGIVMYRLLNDNRAPFLPAYPAPITHSDREGALAKRLSGAKMPEPKNADGRLAEIVLKACAYQPKDRYSSPMQMEHELEAILYDRSEAAIIYPEGDEAPIKSIENIPTDEKEHASNAQASSASRPMYTDSTLDAFNSHNVSDEQEYDKTQSVFESATPSASAEKIPVGKKKRGFLFRAAILIAVILLANGIGRLLSNTFTNRESTAEAPLPPAPTTNVKDLTPTASDAESEETASKIIGGWWQTSQTDLTENLCSDVANSDWGTYFTIDSFSLRRELHFHENGIYISAYYVTSESREALSSAIMSAVEEYERANGQTYADADKINFVQESADKIISSYEESFYTSGNYKIADNKIYISDGLDIPVTDEEFEYFEVSDMTLTIIGDSTGNTRDPYPLEFWKLPDPPTLVQPDMS